jgi:hypothetical protein
VHHLTKDFRQSFQIFRHSLIFLSVTVMVPKLVLANLVGLLAITLVKPTNGKMGNRPSKHYQS